MRPLPDFLSCLVSHELPTARRADRTGGTKPETISLPSQTLKSFFVILFWFVLPTTYPV